MLEMDFRTDEKNKAEAVFRVSDLAISALMSGLARSGGELGTALQSRATRG
jgi:hypothetical protein